ncbi:1-deoxy-D-xylulose-5-phosphate reductoisomerase [Patescibacteria group bacterium]|nr:1-deoxy-D-xylulose-5-phosphate reductoisomerase [Patescibacteria group bacterium]
MKKLVILGSTGSLGTQTLEVLQKHRKEFEVIGLAAGQNTRLLNKQAKSLNCKGISKKDGSAALLKMAAHPEADIVINIISGLAGIKPTFSALKAGKTLILGNKESVVAEGQQIKKYLSQIIPLDSEHNAIYEILKAHPNEKIDYITLPCSGGPLYGKSSQEIVNALTSDLTKHPKWSMGPKITLESATLINKGLEIIEAHYLFKLPFSRIRTKIHPACRIHGMVTFATGETYAYFGQPDMREHIKNCLLGVNPASIKKINPKTQELYEVPHKNLPGIKIVLQAYRNGRIKEFLKKEERIMKNPPSTFAQLLICLRSKKENAK